MSRYDVRNIIEYKKFFATKIGGICPRRNFVVHRGILNPQARSARLLEDSPSNCKLFAFCGIFHKASLAPMLHQETKKPPFWVARSLVVGILNPAGALRAAA